MDLIRLKRVSKYYYNKSSISSGFEKVNLSLNIGEFVVLTGESGSGKSTLLNVISGLDSYEDGEMYINGEETSHYSEEDLEQYRRKYIGNIFQNFNLVNSYTVFQNVELVLLLNGYKKKEVKQKVLDVINMVGLTKYKNTKASKLSGGQKQRVAIARALVKETPIIVADEPTGNLDVKSAKGIMKLLSEISKERLVVIVTHNYEQVEEYATRKITMSDGKIIEDKVLKETKKDEIKAIEYKNITFMNKILLGIRNTFNIKTKFILLTLVYFFLTLLVFSSYSSIRKMDFDSSNDGNNSYFTNASADRIVINKKDRSQFTSEDYDRINNISNIKSVTKDDLFSDISVNLSSDYLGISADVFSISNDLKVDKGRLPENDSEILLKINSTNYIAEDDDIFKYSFIMDDYDGNLIKSNLKIVGFVYDDKLQYYEYGIYASDSILDIARKNNNVKYSNIELTVNNKVYKNTSTTLPFRVLPNQYAEDGKAIITENFNSFCPKEKCYGNNFHIYIKNSYYDTSLDVVPSMVTYKNIFNKYTGLPKEEYENYQYTILISNSDYDRLFVTKPYQASVFVKDINDLYKTADELKSLGFNTYVIKDMMISPMGEFAGVIRILKVVSFFISIIVLFFISYFIIRIVLKSRNVYYSIIRILGSTRRVSKHLLMLELFNDITISFSSFIILIILCSRNIIKVSFIKSLIGYFDLKDYIIVYLILSLMSILIASRYSRKLFKASALETYREEI